MLTLRLEAYERDARASIASAQALADERKHVEVEPLHLLYRLVELAGPVREAIRRAGIDPFDLLVEAEAQLRKLRRTGSGVAFLSPRLLDLLARAEGEAAREHGAHVSVRHLTLAAAQETSGPVKTVLDAVGLSAPVLRELMATAASSGSSPAAGSTPSSSPVLAPTGSATSSPGPRGDPLEQWGLDYTRLAAQGRLDPVVGRDAELRRIVQVLARRSENSPLLVGEPGTGRDAVVRALAQRIARRDVPSMLVDRRIVAVDVGAMVAGARLRGEAEERMRALLGAVRDAGGAVLLYFPSLGALAGERAPSGAVEMLALALMRGELRVIVRASPDELRRARDVDGALVPRLVPIAVDPPGVEGAIAALRVVSPRLETSHGVRIADPALVAAVQMARRYVPGAALPKSAFDLVDEAAARVRVQVDAGPASLDALQRRLEALEVQRRALEDDVDEGSRVERERLHAEIETLRPRVEALRERWTSQVERLRELRRLREERAAAEREVDQARASGDAQRASALQATTLALLDEQIRAAERRLEELGERLVRDVVTADDVAEVVAEWTGIPVTRMVESEAERLLRMEERLRARVVGQDEAVSAVCRAVRRGRVGLRDARRPIGSFLFLGPTGVGKTELARALAELLFDDEAALTRIDMSEFMEKHTVARLLGAPPGYVDSDEGGFLTEAVRRRPYSVVLFDEMEKAHPDVFNILLQVLDEGRLTDSRGRRAHFADTVVIMTSNVGGQAILEHDGPHEALRERVEEELRRHFRPELLNRIDEIVVFRRLSREDLAAIADLQLRALAELLTSRGLRLEVSAPARDRIVELGWDPAFGARPLRRAIQRHLQDPLAQALLEGGWQPGDVVRVELDGERLRIERQPGRPAQAPS
ncbi:MAG: AAA family ATPase [Myxococcota bacterium]|nr:AAA family ATPase [Myxococcota bacterium]MDW8362267.1 AAA family ATPase [Myxococcales bacterium]